MKSFHIFGLSISFLGLMTVIGIFVGLYLAKKEAKRKGLNVNVIEEIAIYTVLSGFVGARVFYILFYNLDYYLQHPIDIFKVYDGGMSIHGALFAAFIAGFIYIRKHKLNFLKYADAIAPSIILGQGIGRVGCDVFGKPMENDYFWGIHYNGQLVHPAQVYEFLLNYIVFFFLWRYRKSVKYDGQLFFLYIIFYSINRGVVEFFRTNPSVIGWFTISHLLSVLFIGLTLIIMIIVKKKSSSIIKIESNEPKYKDLFKDILIVLGIIVISLVIYYTVQS